VITEEQVEQILSVELGDILAISPTIVEEIERLEAEIAAGSRSDLAVFVDSPFYRLLRLYIEEAMSRNVLDMARGDIAIRTRDESGALYRTQESLRGGLIALAGVLHLEEELKQITGSAYKEDKEEADG